jgi:hypothetical protein
MLQRVEGKVGKPSDLLAGGIDAENTALVARSFAFIAAVLGRHDSRPVAVRCRTIKGTTAARRYLILEGHKSLKERFQ